MSDNSGMRQMADRKIVLTGFSDEEDARRGLVAAWDCRDESEGSYIVGVVGEPSGREWTYTVRVLATRISVYAEPPKALP